MFIQSENWGGGGQRDNGATLTKWDQLNLVPDLLRSLTKFGYVFTNLQRSTTHVHELIVLVPRTRFSSVRCPSSFGAPILSPKHRPLRNESLPTLSPLSRSS